RRLSLLNTMPFHVETKQDFQNRPFKTVVSRTNSRGGLLDQRVYEPGVAGAHQWFLDHTVDYIADRMTDAAVAKRKKPTQAQMRLLTLLGLEIPITHQMAEVMLTIAGYRSDGIPRWLDRHQTKKLTDAELLERANREWREGRTTSIQSRKVGIAMTREELTAI